jgi:outer membrane protein TolC
MQWRNFFTNKNLQNLIDTALQNNQELQITLQEIEIAKNEARIRQGFYYQR